eukprot:TRINITY_DN8388_c0_g1_i1.p1 TRINITY_DN8388_c0_g1~~TRINITY_DN8388_c0_g1_i1.p1  ORF type:complete len:418 (-),score=57.32 TRINITY_DN8388_c0_g1_i1:1701-2954(-)
MLVVVLASLLIGVVIADVQEECYCIDVSPGTNYSCLEQKLWGKCDEEWMIQQGYCDYTCSRCNCIPQSSTVDEVAQAQADPNGAITKLEMLMQQIIPAPPSPEEDASQAYYQYLLEQLRIFADQRQQQATVEVESPTLELQVPQSYEVGKNSSTVEEGVEQEMLASVSGVNIAINSQSPQLLASVFDIPLIPYPETEQEVVFSSSTSSPFPVPDTEPNPESTEKVLLTPSNFEASSGESPEIIAEFRRPTDDNPLLDAQEECTPLQSVLQGTPGFQQFARLLKVVDYKIEDHGDGFTLFAPMDQGVAIFLRQYNLNINDLEKMNATSLASFRSKFQPIVKYHVVDTHIESDLVDVLKMLKVQTRFPGKILYVRDLNKRGKTFELIDGQGDRCEVLIADREACEGMVHMVACMLIPDL